ncbi:hypothetical protein G7K71_12100 [Desulfofundulus sp. TPOSR]|uniref:hypothetical protein n=1 Tax=Desulfofundulus TaxID=2282741 RepID=UPI00059E125B|nr:hypothetical protein [Desulfofundulus sp. TPOSR]NHM27707.1 hypothetical protein [Desulfofundulus sp. TPOSR]
MGERPLERAAGWLLAAREDGFNDDADHTESGALPGSLHWDVRETAFRSAKPFLFFRWEPSTQHGS